MIPSVSDKMLITHVPVVYISFGLIDDILVVHKILTNQSSGINVGILEENTQDYVTLISENTNR